MVQVSLDYMSESPKIRLENEPGMTEKEKKLFIETIIPSLQKEINSCFISYKRNTPELGRAITKSMDHGKALEKYHYVFMCYDNKNHVGYYWYSELKDIV